MKTGVFKVIGIISLQMCISGCFLPIPHKRVSRVGCEGIVLDVDTGLPIEGATICFMYGNTNITTHSNSQGYYKIQDGESWHGAYFIGVPASFSLFPTLDGPRIPCAIVITSEGYKSFKWQSCGSFSKIMVSECQYSRGIPASVKLNPIGKDCKEALRDYGK